MSLLAMLAAAGGTGTPVDPPSDPITAPDVTNLKRSNTTVWRAAVNAAQGGAGHPTFYAVGDSITTYGDQSYTAYTGPLLGAALGLPVHRAVNPIFPGSGNVPTTPVIVTGTGWAEYGGASGMNWRGGAGTPGSTGTVELTATCDSFEVIALGTTATVQASVDGGSFTTYTKTAPVTNQTVSITIPAGAVGAHTVAIRPPVSGSTVYVMSVVGLDSTTPSVRWVASGQSGAKTPTVLGRSPVAALPAHMFFMAYGRNDWALDTPLATFETKVRAMVTGGLEQGADVMLWGWPPDRYPTANDVGATVQDYLDVVEEIALDLDVPMLRIDQRWGDWESGNALGYYMDNIHPTITGRQDIAAAITAMLVAAADA